MPKEDKPHWRAECSGSYISNGIDSDGRWYVRSDAPFKVYRKRGIRWDRLSKRVKGGE